MLNTLQRWTACLPFMLFLGHPALLSSVNQAFDTGEKYRRGIRRNYNQNKLDTQRGIWLLKLFTDIHKVTLKNQSVSILIAYCIIGCQLHLTLCDSLDCSPPGFFAHGTSQARILGWVAISYSKEFSQPRDQTHVSCIGNGFFTTEPTGDRTSQVVQWWRSRLPLQETWEMQGKFHGQRSLVGYSPWSHKESDVTEHTQIYFYRKTLSYWKVNVNSGIPFVSQRHWFWFCLPF